MFLLCANYLCMCIKDLLSIIDENPPYIYGIFSFYFDGAKLHIFLISKKKSKLPIDFYFSYKMVYFVTFFFKLSLIYKNFVLSKILKTWKVIKM